MVSILLKRWVLYRGSRFLSEVTVKLLSGLEVRVWFLVRSQEYPKYLIHTGLRMMDGLAGPTPSVGMIRHMLIKLISHGGFRVTAI
ncbi:hypothetical protein Q672_09210 [Marinobacter sp. EVN1]|nr:hypothetical protein Q672_09210 [Marinobacter sp. EVN1]